MNPPESLKPHEYPEYREDEDSGVRERPDLAEQRRRQEVSEKRRAAARRRDEERARQLAQMIQESHGVAPRKQADDVPPVVTEAPGAKPGILSRWGERLRHSRMLKAALVAIGLHVPATPAGQRVLGDAVEWAKGARTEWEKPGMVIKPQSQAERDAVIAKMFEDGARSNAQERDRAKDDFSRKLDRGQDVPLDEMYFELARTNGEDPERIKEAKRRKDELVARLSERMGDDLSDDFIRTVVDEMYGADANYSFGQGSVTEYFVTGKRNCVAIARAEQMVFEALLAKLPPEKRQKFQLGTAMEKRHEIATLTVLNDDGTVNRTLFLQPPVRTIQGSRDRAGSPTVDMATVKRAIVSKEPVRVKAPTKPGEEVADSPDLDVVTNEPVALNIRVDGKLRGSDYVMRIAEERGIKPVKAPPERLVGVQQLELEDDREKRLAAAKELFDQAKRASNEAVNRTSEATGSPYSHLSYTELDVSSLGVPTLEQVRLLNSWDEKGLGSTKPMRVNAGDIENIPNEVLAEMLKTDIEEIAFDIRSANPDKVEEFLELADRSKTDKRIVLIVDDVRNKGSVVPYYMSHGIKNLAFEKKGRAPLSFSGREQEVYTGFATGNLSSEGVEYRPPENLYFTGVKWSKEDIKAFATSKSTIHLGISDYLDCLQEYPELADAKNVRIWINGLVSAPTMDQFIDNNPAIKKNRRAVQMLKDASEVSEAMYSHLVSG